jgi:hypothetical protein
MVIYKIFAFDTDWKSNMAARAHNVFWLVEILKIFLLETIKPIELNKGNNKITELRTILQRESQNS